MSIPMHSTQLLVKVASFVIFLIMIFTPQLSGLFVKFADADFNFAVGDWGCNSNTKNTVTNIKAKNQNEYSLWAIIHIHPPQPAGSIQ